MAPDVLRTKLYVPPERPHSVVRERLLARLDGVCDTRCALVCAPAGFGKTTLLADWARRCRCAVAWLSLDAEDNDPARFWRHFNAALAEVMPDQMLGIAGSLAPDDPDRLVALLNAWAESPEPSALILDDLHLVGSVEIHRGLLTLLEHLPPRAHLVCGTRLDPPWPLARLRGRGELVEVRADRLRFTIGETADLMGGMLGRQLPSDAVAALDARIEGWVAGLQMAAISLRSHLQAEGDAGLDAFVEGLGRSRFILDYLMDEVLDQQDEAMRQFLLTTAVLDRLSAPVCDAVVGIDDSAARLARLDRAHLFLVPLDDEGRWFRYHHLFGQLLKKCLAQERPGAERELHLRASRWFEAHHNLSDAVAHAMAADDVERVAGLVAGNALAIMGRGDLDDLERWANHLPPDLVRTRPWLRVSLAWTLAFGGNLVQAESHLDALDPFVASGLTDHGSGITEHDSCLTNHGSRITFHASRLTPHLLGHAGAIRAYIAGQRGEMDAAANWAREAISLLPERDVAALGFAASILGSVLRWAGDLEAAEKASRQAMAVGQRMGANRVAADAFCDLAALQIVQGRPMDAETTCREALARAARDLRDSGHRLPITGFVHARLSAALLEMNQLDGARHHAQRGVELCEAWGWPDGLFFAHIHLARVLAAWRDDHAALDTIARAKAIARAVSPFMLRLAEAEEACLMVSCGQLARAVQWADRCGLDPDGEVPFWRLDEHLALIVVEAARARGHRPRDGTWREGLRRTLARLDRLLDLAGARGAEGLVIGMLARKATLLHLVGDREAALDALRRALRHAEGRAYVRTFIALGEPMRALLVDAAVTWGGGCREVYVVERLLDALAFEPSESPEPQPSEQPLVEPLTPRELQVLRLLSGHLSSTRIAEHLVVSPNTVRTHIKRIYGKLDAHSREEAVARARALGLMP